MKSEHVDTPVLVDTDPTPFTVPQEILSFAPCREQTHKTFNQGVEIRQIFLNTALDDVELELMQRWRAYCKEINFSLPEVMEPLAFRIVVFCKRKAPNNYLERSIEHAMMMIEWRKAIYPVPEKTYLPELRKGIIYWFGRDKSFRPIAVVRLSRMPKELRDDPSRFKMLVVYLFEWVLRYGFIPGKVETCRVLVDLRDLSLMSIPVKAIKEMVNTLTRQYPFRLDKMYIVNAPKIVNAIWSMVKVCLTEVQQQKMVFMPSNFSEQLLDEYHASQLEVQYGGSHPNLEEPKFYPFVFPEGPFSGKGITEKAPNQPRVRDVWKAIDANTAKGTLWEGNVTRQDLNWSPLADQIFEKCGFHRESRHDDKLQPSVELANVFASHHHRLSTAVAADDVDDLLMGVRLEEKEAVPNSDAAIAATSFHSTSECIVVVREGVYAAPEAVPFLVEDDDRLSDTIGLGVDEIVHGENKQTLNVTDGFRSCESSPLHRDHHPCTSFPDPVANAEAIGTGETQQQQQPTTDYNSDNPRTTIIDLTHYQSTQQEQVISGGGEQDEAPSKCCRGCRIQ